MFIGIIAPIVILSCSVHRNRSFVAPSQAVSISFVDRGASPVDEVRFAVSYHGREEILRDRGTFSQGVTINHAFSGFRGALYYEPTPLSCAVQYVHFSDGSSWSNS